MNPQPNQANAQGARPTGQIPAFPPPLPEKFRKLLGGEFVSLRVEYTVYGVQVLVVREDGTTQLAEVAERARRQAIATRGLETDRIRYLQRVQERGIAVQVPAVFASVQAKEQWLVGLPAAQRRLVEMTNREFRAQQGPNVPAGNGQPAAQGQQN